MRTALLSGARLLGQVASNTTVECLVPPLARSSGTSSSAAVQRWRALQQCAQLGLSAPRSSGFQVFRGFAAASRPSNAAQKAATAAATGAGKAAAAPSSFSRWWKAFQSAPTVPKMLGLAGAIPFIALAPPVSKHLTGVLPGDIVDNSGMIQVCYGVTIVSFLGAVHWGVAMTSSLAGPVAARIANEAFIYSVLPSLAAWPVALMEPGAGAVVMSLLLPACYLADYSRRNLGLPQWYMALRLPLTLLATFGMLLTATRHVHQELDRAKQITEANAAAPNSVKD